MRTDLLTPAAILAQSILKSVEEQHNELTPEVVASAFLGAYDAIEIAMREHSEKNPPAMY